MKRIATLFSILMMLMFISCGKEVTPAKPVIAPTVNTVEPSTKVYSAEITALLPEVEEYNISLTEYRLDDPKEVLRLKENINEAAKLLGGGRIDINNIEDQLNHRNKASDINVKTLLEAADKYGIDTKPFIIDGKVDVISLWKVVDVERQKGPVKSPTLAE